MAVKVLKYLCATMDVTHNFGIASKTAKKNSRFPYNLSVNNPTLKKKKKKKGNTMIVHCFRFRNEWPPPTHEKDSIRHMLKFEESVVKTRF